MPFYNYRAMNERGRMVRGQLNASNENDLYQRLRDTGLELVAADEVVQNRWTAMLAAKVGFRDLIQMCVHLQQLNGAGVSLIDGLADVRDATEQARLRDSVSEIHSDVSEGKSLSQAFDRHPKIFGHVFTSLLAAGEESGNLTESFGQLVKHLKWTDAVQNKIKKATRYPMFMLFVILCLFFFMMMVVVPQVVSFLISSGQQLPAVTVALIATSDFVIEKWYVIVGTPIVLFLAIKLGSQTSVEFRYKIDYYILRLPVIGNLIRKISLSRFCHFFAVMFQSGVPILQCLETAQQVVDNLVLKESLRVVRESVQQGNPLSSALKDTNEFPGLVVRMVKIGEDSGNLSETLENVTGFYDNDVNEAVDALIAMIEPALTFIGGGIMAWIAIAVIGPIYETISKMG
jgi:type IV pilus assembly protein PilC